MISAPGPELRVGFIGCGLIAASHARGLARTARADIGPVFDPDRARADTFAATFAGHVVADAEAVVAGSDAVYVCTWTSEHLPMVELVVGSGRAVFCEKPLSTDLTSARRLHEIVAAAGVTHQVGLVLRHSPAFRWLRHQVIGPDQVSNPSLMNPSLMNIVFRDDQYIPIQGMYGSTWRADRARAGAGTLLEHSIHDLDLLDWIMGPISSVQARLANHHDHEGIEDAATVTLTNDAGAQAVLTSVWHDVLSRPSQRRVEVFCRDRFLALEGDWNGPVTIETSDSSTSIEGTDLATAAADADGLGTNPDAAFVDAVLDGTPAYPGTGVALRAHVLTDAAYRSAAAGGVPIGVSEG